MTKWMRLALLATGVMNMFGAVIFMPMFAQLRDFNGLPNGAHPLYLWIIAVWIFLFGLCYSWLGVSGHRERLFLVIGAGGKLSFFALLVVYWMNRELPIQAPVGGLADLVFGIIFIIWLWQTRNDEDRSPSESSKG